MPPTCTTGFTVQEVITLLVAVLGLIGIPVGIQFRAMQAQSRELMDLLKDQLGILEDQANTQKTTEQVIRRRNQR